MASIGMLSAAYKFYSSATKVRSTLSTITDLGKWVSESLFIPTKDLENLHPVVRQRLEKLARRISVLSQPLNFCLLWSQHKGSAVAESVHQCKEVLKQVYGFLAECSKDKSKLSDKEFMITQLDEHIREIEFCLQALNLAMSIIQTSSCNQAGWIGQEMTGSSLILAGPSAMLSGSCLLRASNRICEMHNTGGDVSLCFGQFFVLHRSSNQHWQRQFRRASLKVYRNRRRRVYELHVEDHVESTQQQKWDLNQGISFRSVSSLSLNLPHLREAVSEDPQKEAHLMEDAFTWVEMVANQVQSQYAFVFKSGLDNWDKPLSDDDEDEEDGSEWDELAFRQDATHRDGIQTQIAPERPVRTRNYEAKLEEDHFSSVVTMHRSFAESSTTTNGNDHTKTNGSSSRTSRGHRDDGSRNDNNSVSPQFVAANPHADAQLTQSVLSLRHHVDNARDGTHLKDMLAPGGDYDETHTTPQLMGYMVRICIYENDTSYPVIPRQTVAKTGRSSRQRTASSDSSENLSNLISSTNSAHEDGLLKTGGLAKDIPSLQRSVPSHLFASDEELVLILRNPPMEDMQISTSSLSGQRLDEGPPAARASASHAPEFGFSSRSRRSPQDIVHHEMPEDRIERRLPTDHRALDERFEDDSPYLMTGEDPSSRIGVAANTRMF